MNLILAGLIGCSLHFGILIPLVITCMFTIDLTIVFLSYFICKIFDNGYTIWHLLIGKKFGDIHVITSIMKEKINNIKLNTTLDLFNVEKTLNWLEYLNANEEKINNISKTLNCGYNEAEALVKLVDDGFDIMTVKNNYPTYDTIIRIRDIVDFDIYEIYEALGDKRVNVVNGAILFLINKLELLTLDESKEILDNLKNKYLPYFSVNGKSIKADNFYNAAELSDDIGEIIVECQDVKKYYYKEKEEVEISSPYDFYLRKHMTEISELCHDANQARKDMLELNINLQKVEIFYRENDIIKTEIDYIYPSIKELVMMINDGDSDLFITDDEWEDITK
jgi:hypothetical protein